MGRGGANMGKVLKGKSRDVETKKKTPIAAPEKDTLQVDKDRWNRQAKRLKALIAQESENARINSRLVTTLMRAQLRKNKMEELEDDVAWMAQEHQREMDRKDAVIQTLQNRLGEVEDQFLVMQRSHMQKLGILNDIHKTKIRHLEAEFERDLKILKQEFNTEKDYIQKSHERMKRELLAIKKAVEVKVNEKSDEQKTKHETIREEIKNKNLDAINELRINLENKIDELEKQFDEAHAAYVEKTKDKNREFKRLQESDREFTQENKRTKRKINKLQAALRHTKHEIEMNRKECNSRNETLKEQRDLTVQHCRDLKARMSKLREQAKNRLIDLTVQSRAAQKKNEANIAVAERILTLMETARKMETEREKILPFYDTKLITTEEKEMVEKEGDKFVSEMKTAGMKQVKVSTKGDAIEEWDDLSNFHKKYNKVLLDKLAIGQEKKRLKEENEDLKMVLQQYLDGIAITPDAVDNPNSLLIINGRTDFQQVPARVKRKVVSLEANQVVAAQNRQAGGRQRS